MTLLERTSFLPLCLAVSLVTGLFANAEQPCEPDFSQLPSQFQLIVTALPKLGASVLEIALDDFHFVNGCPLFNSDGSNLDGDGLIDSCDSCPLDAADEDGYFYVVTRTSDQDEGSPGTRSDGSERIFEASCP